MTNTEASREAMEKPAPFTPEQKKTLDDIAAMDRDQLKRWQQVLEHAQAQVAYWKAASDHSSALALRATMQSW